MTTLTMGFIQSTKDIEMNMFDAFLNFSNLFPSLAITKQIIQNRKISTLTLYTLTSVCKSSTLFSLHFLWHLEGQFV